MTDLYDELISVLGLDAARQDRLIGTILRQFPTLGFSGGPGRLSPSLCRLPDGRTQLVFRVASFGEHWVGFLPCSATNLALLGEFLSRVHRHLPDSDAKFKPAGVLAQMVQAIDPGDPLEAMPEPPDQHLEAGIGLKLFGDNAHGPQLQFTIRGPRGLLRNHLAWTPELAAYWKEVFLAAWNNQTAWSGS